MILTVIPFQTSDWDRAERLLDWIYQQRQQQPLDHVLLVAAHDTHPEMRLRVKISATLAFNSVIEFTAPPLNIPDARYHLFRQSALYVGRSMRCPWLYLEPDCVTLTGGWMTELEAAYEMQPFRYLGPYGKTAEDAIVLGRCSIHPAGAINDLEANRDPVPMSSKCRLMQLGQFNEGDTLDKVRPDAVLFHSCQSDALIKLLRAKKPEEVKLRAESCQVSRLVNVPIKKA